MTPNANAFLPAKLHQERPKRMTQTHNAKKMKPAVEQGTEKGGIAFRQNMIFTTGDESELDRIEDYLRELGIRRLDRSKLLRIALRAAFRNPKELDIAALLAEVMSSDKRHKRSIYCV